MDELTKLTGRMIAAVSDQVNHVDKDGLRLTIEARREKARQLLESGLSKRKAAKVVWISETQLRRDVLQRGADYAPKGRRGPLRRVCVA